MTARMPDLSDSSRISAMPSIRLSRTSSPICIEQVGLVHLIRKLVDDDRLAVALLHVLDMGACANHHAAAAGAKAVFDAARAVDDARASENPAPARS